MWGGVCACVGVCLHVWVCVACVCVKGRNQKHLYRWFRLERGRGEKRERREEGKGRERYLMREKREREEGGRRRKILRLILLSSQVVPQDLEVDL